MEIMYLQANDWWTKPCKWAAHNEERRNTMKTNFQWKFMPRVSTTGSMLADIMDASKKKQHKCGSKLFTVKYIRVSAGAKLFNIYGCLGQSLVN